MAIFKPIISFINRPRGRSLVREYFVTNEIGAFLWAPIDKYISETLRHFILQSPQIFLIPIEWPMPRLFYHFIKTTKVSNVTHVVPDLLHSWNTHLESELGRRLTDNENYLKNLSIPHNWHNIYKVF